jgi:hypothetical protein
MLTPLPPHHLPTTALGPIAPLAHRRQMLEQCTWRHPQRPPGQALKLIWPHGAKARGQQVRKPSSRPVLKLVKPYRDAEHIMGRW